MGHSSPQALHVGSHQVRVDIGESDVLRSGEPFLSGNLHAMLRVLLRLLRQMAAWERLMKIVPSPQSSVMIPGFHFESQPMCACEVIRRLGRFGRSLRELSTQVISGV
jgi:hypothetical protein